ncbi:hypothetical protein ACF1BU_36640 [Streptomyces sp. NPDC014724]|uniref:hypothetical protein n=1 Tax=unclassified Streptomyces TaxID=2593676 RepID=UPI0036FCD773
MSHSTPPGSWDGSWYRVHTAHFEAAFLPNADEDLESVDNVDVFVDLKDGSRWSATMITLAQVEVIMSGPGLQLVRSHAQSHSVTGPSLAQARVPPHLHRRIQQVPAQRRRPPASS